LPRLGGGADVADDSIVSFVYFAVACIAAAGLVTSLGCGQTTGTGTGRLYGAAEVSAGPETRIDPAADDGAAADNPRVQPDKFPVSIRRPAGPPRVASGQRDAEGNEVMIACSTCHTTRPPNHQNKIVSDFDEFHQNMPFSHGAVSCLSCHNASDYDALKLADGRRVEFSDVMTLCGQCHGPQMKAFQHGAHGGMTGYWDLTRGPQTKNNCVECHDPHTPQFPKMRPTFKPRDRFLEQPGTDH